MNKELIKHPDKSVTLSGLHDGIGSARSINLHGYRVATTNAPRLAISILNQKNEYLGTVVLEPCDLPILFEQICNMM